MRRYLIMFGALVCMATLWADNVRFAVDGPRQVIQGQQFQLEYTLYNASGKESSNGYVLTLSQRRKGQ